MIKIRDLKIQGLEMEDGGVGHYETIYWWPLCLNDEDEETEYKRIVKDIDDYSVTRQDYVVWAWYDISGYKYWKEEREENYIQTSVTFLNEEVSEEVVKALEKDLIDTYHHFKQYENYRMTTDRLFYKHY